MEYALRDGKGTKVKSFKEFKLKDGTLIGVFQGSRGQNPDLDIIVKYKEPNKSVRTPQHIHWAIDLLIKKEHNRELTKKFVKYLLDIWDDIMPFENKQEQQKCKLKSTSSEKLKNFEELNNYGEYSIEFIDHILELIMIQEKTGLARAFMFRGVLEAIYKDKDIFSIVAQARYSGK